MDILKKIKKAKKIIIIGRGPSSRYFKKKNNLDFLIGINLKKINDIMFDAILSNNLIRSLGKTKSSFYLNKVVNYKIFVVISWMNYIYIIFLLKIKKNK